MMSFAEIDALIELVLRTPMSQAETQWVMSLIGRLDAEKQARAQQAQPEQSEPPADTNIDTPGPSAA